MRGRYGCFPEWHIYNDWVNDNFAKTHDIKYHYSNKNVGKGTYNLNHKEKGNAKWQTQ